MPYFSMMKDYSLFYNWEYLLQKNYCDFLMHCYIYIHNNPTRKTLLLTICTSEEIVAQRSETMYSMLQNKEVAETGHTQVCVL